MSDCFQDVWAANHTLTSISAKCCLRWQIAVSCLTGNSCSRMCRSKTPKLRQSTLKHTQEVVLICRRGKACYDLGCQNGHTPLYVQAHDDLNALKKPNEDAKKLLSEAHARILKVFSSLLVVCLVFFLHALILSEQDVSRLLAVSDRLSCYSVTSVYLGAVQERGARSVAWGAAYLAVSPALLRGPL